MSKNSKNFWRIFLKKFGGIFYDFFKKYRHKDFVKKLKWKF
jgi:hypothetical protein